MSKIILLESQIQGNSGLRKMPKEIVQVLGKLLATFFDGGLGSGLKRANLVWSLLTLLTESQKMS